MLRRRILLADDFDDAREMYAEYLQFHGYDVVTAADGNSAVEAARTQTPDIVLLDIRMPGMNGMDAMRVLKAEPSLGDVPIVALTARALSEERDAALKAGFDAFISKPVMPDQLLNQLETILSAHSRRDRERRSAS